MTSLSTQTPAPADRWGVPTVAVKLTQAFDDIVASNPQLHFEQTASGEIVIMTPTGGESGARNSRLVYQLQRWAEAGGGIVFDSSTLFCLPSGAKRSPDASWISTSRWTALSKEDRKRYPPICPDFVIELRSETDRLSDLTLKMTEYMSNGALLAWLIDPLLRQVHVYRKDIVTEIQTNVPSIAADQTLPGFVLDLQPLWLEDLQ